MLKVVFCFLHFQWFGWFLCMFIKELCSMKGFACFWSDCDILIVLRILLSIEVYIMCIRMRWQKNIAPRKWRSPYTFFIFAISDGRQSETQIAEILRFQSSGKATHAIVEICPYKRQWWKKHRTQEKQDPSLYFPFILILWLPFEKGRNKLVDGSLWRNGFSPKRRWL